MDFYISHFFNCCYYSLYDKLKYSLIFWSVLTHDLLKRTEASVTHSAVPHVLLCCFNYILMLSVIYSWKDLQQHGVHLLITCWIPNATNETSIFQKIVTCISTSIFDIGLCSNLSENLFFSFFIKKKFKGNFHTKSKIKVNQEHSSFNVKKISLTRECSTKGRYGRNLNTSFKDIIFQISYPYRFLLENQLI